MLTSLTFAEVTLRMVVWDGDEALAVLRKETAAFEKAHPGIKVKLESADYKLYFQKLLAQFAAESAPDVAMLDPANFQRYAKRGALLKLNQFYDTPGFNIKDYYKPIVDAHSMKGSLYVLPRDIAPFGLIYYNKRLLREAGIDPPDGSWTWDFKPRPELGSKDFITCMQKLTKFDEKGKVKQWGFSAWDSQPFTDTLVYSSGARYVDDPEAFRQLKFTDPKVVRCYDYVAELSQKRHWMPTQSELTTVVQSTAVDLFISQKLAMFQGGIWFVPHIRKAMKPGSPEFFDWDIAPAPGYQEGLNGPINHAGATGGSGYGIVSSTKHPREAWELTRWMAGAPGMNAMAAAGIAQPAIEKLATSDVWIPGPNTPIDQQYPHNRIVTHNLVSTVVFAPSAEYWSEVNGLVNSKSDTIYNGTSAAGPALAEGQRIGMERLNDILKQENLKPLNWPLSFAIGIGLLFALIYWIFKPELGKKLTFSERSEAKAGFWFASPWIFGTVIFTVGPMLLSFLMSFTDWDFITPARSRGLTNFTEALTRDARFWVSLKVTLIYTFVSVPLGLSVAMGLALLLNTKVRGVPVYRTFFYLPSLASMVASSLIWRKVFQPDGGILNVLLFGPDGTWRLPIISSLVGADGKLPDWMGSEHLALSALILMSTWGVGAGMVILLAGLQGIPDFYYEAATLDGAGPIQKFRAVTVPMVSPAIIFAFVTGLIGSFQAFTQVFVMTNGDGGPNNATRFYMLHLYDAAFNNLRMGYASALAWILFAIVFVASMAQFRLNKYVYYEGGSR